jgi:hypothetical protein
MDITFHQQKDVIPAYAGMTRNWDSSEMEAFDAKALWRKVRKVRKE